MPCLERVSEKSAHHRPPPSGIGLGQWAVSQGTAIAKCSPTSSPECGVRMPAQRTWLAISAGGGLPQSTVSHWHTQSWVPFSGSPNHPDHDSRTSGFNQEVNTTVLGSTWVGGEDCKQESESLLLWTCQ